MQHKRTPPFKPVLLGLLLACLAGAGVFLAVSPIPAPEQPIEQEIHAEALPTPAHP